MLVKRFGKIATILVLSFYAVQLNAQHNTSMKASAIELLKLPPECQKAMKGGDWGGHYCQGFLFMNRANSTFDKGARRFYLGVARNEFDYVASHSPFGSPQAKQAQSYKAMVEYMLDYIVK